MKKLFFLGILTFLALPVLAQIDDVIHKPRIDDVIHKPRRERMKYSDPSIFTQTAKVIFSIFKQIEISSLVDQMKSEGVTERKFNAVLTVSGYVAAVNVDSEGDDKSQHILPFDLKLTGNKQIALTAAIGGFSDLFEGSLDGNFEGTVPVAESKYFVFKMDQGVEFRDVKSIGWRLFDANFKIGVIADGPDKYFAITLGTELGGGTEEVILDDGQVIKLNGNDIETDHYMGFQYGIRGGIDIKGLAGKGTVEVKAQVNATGTSISGVKHDKVYFQPSISYSRSVSDNKTLTFGVQGNLAIKDKVKANGLEYDLGNRSRRPISVSAKITF